MQQARHEGMCTVAPPQKGLRILESRAQGLEKRTVVLLKTKRALDFRQEGVDALNLGQATLSPTVFSAMASYFKIFPTFAGFSSR